MISTRDWIMGYSDDETVMLDFDDTELGFVEYWVNRALKWFELGGYIILESSSRCYHVVFDKKVDWSENMRIVAWVALLSGNEGLQRWQLMQCIKMKSTLRISEKLEKNSPKIVVRVGSQNNKIADFIAGQKEIKYLSKGVIPLTEILEVSIVGN